MTPNQSQEIVSWINKFDYPGRIITNEAKKAMAMLQNTEPENIESKQKSEYTNSRGKYVLTIYAKNFMIYFSSKLAKRIIELEWPGIEIILIESAMVIRSGPNPIYKNTKNSSVINSKQMCVSIHEHCNINKSDKLILDIVEIQNEGNQVFQIINPEKN